MRAALPGWAEWHETRRWSLGVEEEVMLLDPSSWSLAPVIDLLLPSLGRQLAGHVAAETHAATLELATGVHRRVGAAAAELSALRERLRAELVQAGLQPAVGGTHPLSSWEESRVSMGARYQLLESSMRDLARREPTFALHVHVGVPDPELAVSVMDRMRAHIPLLLALSANSPFLRGRDTGFASMRTSVFQGFPRVGIPRRFGSYRAWVDAVAPLVDSGAFPEPTFLWWDIRVQPRLGTLEIRAMDAQTTVDDVAALVAFVQCLVVLEATEGFACERLLDAPEVLDENRFLAARDGLEAEFVDPTTRTRVPARVLVAEALIAARLHAERLGCADELDLVEQILDSPPCERQRAAAEEQGEMRAAVVAMADAFCDPSQDPGARRRAIA